jgi:hypothetical protein
MSKVVRYQFMGNWLIFWVLCVFVIFIPIALLYLLNSTLRLDSEVDDPERFVTEYRAGKLATG